MNDRSLDTMSEAIAMSSPSGHMSKRARKAARERLRVALFGQQGLQRTRLVISNEQERGLLLQRARELRAMAAGGMRPRAFVKEAERLEAKAAELSGAAAPKRLL